LTKYIIPYLKAAPFAGAKWRAPENQNKNSLQSNLTDEELLKIGEKLEY